MTCEKTPIFARAAVVHVVAWALCVACLICVAFLVGSCVGKRDVAPDASIASPVETPAAPDVEEPAKDASAGERAVEEEDREDAESDGGDSSEDGVESEGANVARFAGVFQNKDDWAAYKRYFDEKLEAFDELDAKEIEDLRAYAADAKETIEKVDVDALPESERDAFAQARELAERAQSKLQEVAPVAREFDENGFALAPFDRTVERIPFGYKGCDIATVVAALRSRADRWNVAIKRGERSRDYDRRLETIYESAKNRALFGDVKYGDSLAFVLQNTDRKLWSDADSVEATLKSKTAITLRKVDFENDRGAYATMGLSDFQESLGAPRFFPETCDLRESRPFLVKYEAQTATATTALWELALYGLIVDFDNVRPKNRESASFVWNVTNLPKEKAEDALRDARVLCVCSLDPQGDEAYGLFARAGRRECFDRWTYRVVEAFNQVDYALHVRDVEFWVYNAKSGEVYAKFTSDDTFNGKTRRYVDPDAEKTPPKPAEEPVDAEPSFAEKWDATRAAYAPPSPESIVGETFLYSGGDSLATTLKLAKSGDSIRLVGVDGEPISLGSGLGGGERIVAKAVDLFALRGEPDERPVVEIGARETLEIDSDARIENVVFRCAQPSDRDDTPPAVVVAPGREVVFDHCAFVATSSEGDLVGVRVAGDGASASFFGCEFANFGESAITASDGARATILFCELSENDVGVDCRNEAKVDAADSYFARNMTAILASGGGRAVAERSFFDGNVVDKRGAIVEIRESESRP